MKILLVIDTLKSGGAERQFVELVKGLSKENNLQIEIFLFSDKIEYNEIYQTNVKINISVRKKKFDKNTYLSLNSTIKRFQPDIVHSWHFITNLYLLPIILSRKLLFIDGSIRNAVKLKVFSAYNMIYKIFNYLAVFTVSNSKAGLLAYNVKKKGIVIHNGIDLKRFGTNKLDESDYQFRKMNGNIIVAMVARFSNHKDYLTFLTAAEKITSENKEVIFLAVGEGPNLEAYMNKYKNNQNIIFTGRISKVENLLPLIEIGVLLSCPKYHSEGISNSIMEYMASSKPVVATRDGGTKEIVIENHNGILINPNSELEFYNSVNDLIYNPGRRNTLGLNGLKFITENFSFSKMVNEYIELYKRAKA